jgi:exopolyphosphatase / guanosine-5'-triphosphate,3'-diphosphate pyrophosphatase
MFRNLPNIIKSNEMAEDPIAKALVDGSPTGLLSRVGIVDVGSNSVRMVIFDGAARSPAYFFNEKVMCGLGRSLSDTGMLHPEGKVRALAALRRFSLLAKGMGIEALTVVGTAAMREARDGPAFQQQILSEIGLPISIVDGNEEARLSAQGVLLGWPDAQGIVCDIGGNSMELAAVSQGAVGARVSTPLGPFRLQQVSDDPIVRAEHIEKLLIPALADLSATGQRIYLVGGSWRVIARLDMERRKYPLTVLHEYRMKIPDLLETLDWIEHSDLAALRQKTGVSSERLDLVPMACEVLRVLIRLANPSEIDISAYGIREGLLYEKMPPALRARDPLIDAARLAEATQSRMPGFGQKLYDFLLPLFVNAPVARMRLIKAACLLHDTTWRTHPDFRAEACFDNATRSNLAGLDHPERVFLGLALMHRYKNSRSGSRYAPMFELLSPDEIQSAEILGKAMRFGAMFAVGDPSRVCQLTWDADKRLLGLNLTEEGQSLLGEVARARLGSLANAMQAKTKFGTLSDAASRL